MKRLHIEFVSCPQSSSGFSSRSPSLRRRKDGSLFWWTVIITLLLGVATFCWFFSIYVFAHPEKPLNYKLLTRLEKLEPPQRFSALNVPEGQFLSAEQLYGKFYSLGQKHLKVANALLKRQFLMNYHEEAPTYVDGRFRIYHVRRLTADDAITSGLVVRAKSHDRREVVIEFLFPAETLPDDPERLFSVGDDLSLDRSSTFASLVHVEKLPDARICLSLVPLVYGTYRIDDSSALTLAPPERLNIEAPWPITDESVGDGSAVPTVADSDL